jgi:hypothetical protein
MDDNLASRGNRETSGVKRSVDLVVALLRHVGGLDARIAFERSFKMVHGQLFEDRFLLGIDRLGRAGPLDEEIVSTCKKIGMPHDLLASFKRTLAEANNVYFGAENDENSLIFKAYLEFRDKIEEEIARAPVAGQSYSLFTGFKWDARYPARQAVTRYLWHPSLPITEILQRLRVIIDPLAHDVLYGVARAMTERVSATIAHDEIQYLEVTEEGNPRTSFDINMYKAGHQVQEMHALLVKAMQHYATPPAQFDSLYERIKTERFGHLAGGVDRQGRDFMTVYYGVKQTEGRRLQSAAVSQDRR